VSAADAENARLRRRERSAGSRHLPRTAPSASVPRRVVTVVIASLVQLAILSWAARVALSQAQQCDVCDTAYYYAAAADFARTGLLFANGYDGYRSYFVPAFIASIQWLAAAIGFDGSAIARYTYGVALLFWLASSMLMAWLARSDDTRSLPLVAAATLANPVAVVYVPFAMQEGVLMAIVLPLLFVWAAKRLEPWTRAALVLAMALIAYTIRAALVWWLLPSVLYAGWMMRPHVHMPRRWLPSLAAIVVAAGLLLAPQIYVAKTKLGSFNPYPETSLFAHQIAFGVDILKYATVEDEGHWRGLVFWSPFVAEPAADKTLRFYVQHPMRGAFLAVSHAYAGLHYDQILPYWRLARARPLTIWLVLSSAIVFLGVVRMTRLIASGALDADAAFAIATFALCAGALLFVAAEARFGVLGFAMLSLLVARWFAAPLSRREWLLLAPALVLYLLLSFAFNLLLLQNADVRL
jgi:hypothetical protein